MLYLLPITFILAYLLSVPRFRARENAHEDRLTTIYRDCYSLHRRELRKLRFYWLCAWGSPLIGWALWWRVEALQSPTGVILLFTCAFFLFLLGLRIGASVDRKVMQLTRKGLQVEKRMKEVSYFKSFFRKRRGLFLWLYTFCRLTPLVFILYPLFFYGVSSLTLGKVSSFYIQTLPVGTLFFIATWISSRGPSSPLDHR